MTEVVHESCDVCENYWRTFRERDVLPYLPHVERSEWAERLFRDYVAKDAPLTEIGCGSGRNLAYLHSQGYSNLYAVEIGDIPLQIFEREFPDAYAATRLFHGRIEDALENWQFERPRLVFTMAVLMHVHPDVDCLS